MSQQQKEESKSPTDDIGARVIAETRCWAPGDPPHLAHLELEEASLLLHLLGNLRAADLRADHSVLPSVLLLLLLDLGAAYWHCGPGVGGKEEENMFGFKATPGARGHALTNIYTCLHYPPPPHTHTHINTHFHTNIYIYNTNTHGHIQCMQYAHTIILESVSHI